MADPEPGGTRDQGGPAVLLIGGLLTSPLWYWPQRQHFVERGAGRVEVAPVWLWHWILAAFVGAEQGASDVADAIERLYAEDGRPIVVVGHSGGGILARLALARRPFGKARRARPEHVHTVVTLGSPHLATRFGGAIGREGMRALRFLAEEDRAPGPPVAWTLMTVGGRAPEPGSGWLGRARRVLTTTCYRALLGAKSKGVPGDGMVPLACSVMPDREPMELDGIAHAPFFGAPWYFSSKAFDQWWPKALDLWRDRSSDLQSAT